MKMFISPSRIYLHRQFVDFRKSINGLSVIIDSELDLPVMSGDLFIFCNKLIKTDEKIHTSRFYVQFRVIF